MGNKFSSWKRNKSSTARMVTQSSDPLVISLMSKNVEMNKPGKIRKDSHLKLFCFNYVFKTAARHPIMRTYNLWKSELV